MKTSSSFPTLYFRLPSSAPQPNKPMKSNQTMKWILGLIMLLAAALPPAAWSAGPGAFSSVVVGSGNQDANVGLSSSKTYYNAINLQGGALTVNGVSFAASSGGNPSGTGFTISGVGTTWGPGTWGNLVTGNIGSMLNDFIYGGNPGFFTLNGLTVGQTYILTFYNGAWDNGDRTLNFATTSGATTSFNENSGGAGNLNLLRYTFTASGTSETLSISPVAAGNTMHMYGFATEQAFNKSWVSGANWTTATWSPAGTPNSQGANANFTAQGAPPTLTLDAPQTVGHLQFDGANGWTLAGASALTLYADMGGVSVLSTPTGSHTNSTALTWNNDVMKVGNGAFYLLGTLTGKSNSTFYVNGGTLDGASASGTVPNLKVTSGVATIGTLMTVTNTRLSAGTLNFNSTQSGNKLLALTGGAVKFGSGVTIATSDFSDPGSGTANATNSVTITSTLKLPATITATLAGATSFNVSGSNIVRDLLTGAVLAP